MGSTRSALTLESDASRSPRYEERLAAQKPWLGTRNRACRLTAREALFAPKRFMKADPMTDFKDRERAEEAKFAMDADTAFRIAARRNRLLGHWAAEKMGLTAEETEAYAKAVIQADFEEAGDEDVIRKVLGDLTARRRRHRRGRRARGARGQDRRGAPPADGRRLTMAMPAAEIEALIKAALPDAEVTIEDLAGDGDHYSARVVSAAFAGKNRVQQRKMVYEALGGRMGGELHALQLVTALPN